MVRNKIVTQKHTIPDRVVALLLPIRINIKKSNDRHKEHDERY